MTLKRAGTAPKKKKAGAGKRAQPRGEKHWFAVHELFTFVTSKRQRAFTVFEDVYVVRAGSVAEAKRRVDPAIRAELWPDPSLTLDGKPAKMQFVGLRRIVTCSPPIRRLPRSPAALEEGTEVTFSRFRVHSRAALRHLAQGDEVEVVYEP